MTADLERLTHAAFVALFRYLESPPGHAAAREAELRAAFADLTRRHPPLKSADGYLGLAYPVACLIDELATAHPEFGPAWTEAKLEVELVGTNDRAWQFWRQAELALTRAADDAELFLTCHGLGFQGEPPGGPTAAARWVAEARARALAALREPPPLPVASAAADPATPHRGKVRLRQAGVAATLTLTLVIPTIAFLLTSGVSR